MLNTFLLYLLCGLVVSHLTVQKDPKSYGQEAMFLYVIGTIFWPILAFIILCMTIHAYLTDQL